ncbi:PRP38-domain-containing protein [Ascodesmis nigricans]|uniref:Pre-mRNA-splicing factor 38 n=1 Tax=Ascodesmis nigricans TaxID=341454 RepID=A0A4S2N2V5_9PEZI|nr:PRP38-domain-containing protein [Ascodesmis nigricans]
MPSASPEPEKKHKPKHDHTVSHKADAKSLLDSRGLYDGVTVHGVNPLLLMEKIIRDRILDSLYYKELCFGLNAATLLDRATELTYLGGVYSTTKPTPFLCLLFKILELQPPRAIIEAYLDAGGEEWKYLRCLAAMYVRLCWNAVDVYTTLEKYLADYRKIKIRGQGGWRLGYVDDFIDELLTKERVCDVALPRMMTRAMLEDVGELEPRESMLGSEVESDGDEEEEEAARRMPVREGSEEGELEVSGPEEDGERMRDD